MVSALFVPLQSPALQSMVLAYATPAIGSTAGTTNVDIGTALLMLFSPLRAGWVTAAGW